MGRKKFASSEQLISHWERRAKYLRRSVSQDRAAPQVLKCIAELKEFLETREPSGLRDQYVSASMERVVEFAKTFDKTDLNAFAKTAVLGELRTMYDAGYQHGHEDATQDRGEN